MKSPLNFSDQRIIEKYVKYPGFLDSLSQDTVDSGKVLHHFIFRCVGWAYSDTKLFPSDNAILKLDESVTLS